MEQALREARDRPRRHRARAAHADRDRGASRVARRRGHRALWLMLGRVACQRRRHRVTDVRLDVMREARERDQRATSAFSSASPTARAPRCRSTATIHCASPPRRSSSQRAEEVSTGTRDDDHEVLADLPHSERGGRRAALHPVCAESGDAGRRSSRRGNRRTRRGMALHVRFASARDHFNLSRSPRLATVGTPKQSSRRAVSAFTPFSRPCAAPDHATPPRSVP